MFSSVDTIWVLFGAVLVFFMQPGFTMVEAGLTRAKNSGNIVMKNVMDFCLGTFVFWIIGFGIMFGGDGTLVGGLDIFIRGNYDATFPTAAFVIFQTVFCATAATIVSGAMAERTKFISYCIYSMIISALIYPVSGHWIWGGGWLSELGFHDFAGSTAVHMVGGIAAFVGAAIIGPRIGKYSNNGKANAIPGHSIPLAALGVFILWFGWFGFNGGSTVCMTGDDVLESAGRIFVTTNMAAVMSTITVMVITWVKYKKPDVSMTLNGTLAGLVGITAGCDIVSPAGAAIIGVISGFLVTGSIAFIDKVLHVDDPVGAVGVHGVCGATGTLCVGLFATEGGLFYGGGVHMFMIQLLGIVAVGIWVAVTMTIVFRILKKTVGLRVTKQEEIEGLDIHEHGLSSGYADFMPVTEFRAFAADLPSSLPVAVSSGSAGEPSAEEQSLTKLTVIINSDRFEELKKVLAGIGINGMTVTQVMGCGAQKGISRYYRGVSVTANLLPKIKIEIIINSASADNVISTIRNTISSGNIGDGKIFIYDVENVVRIRNGESGIRALQDDSES